MKSNTTRATARPIVQGADKAARPRAADRIRKTASELFYREGIRAIGVDEIVTRAGVTKPSLYRSFPSKDELAAAYLRDYDAAVLQRFDEAMATHPGDPRAGVMAYFRDLQQRADRKGYRGCGLSNAAVEYPHREHPARQVAEAHKRSMRLRLRTAAQQLGAPDPAALGDSLMLLMEGCYLSGQLFGAEGPARMLADAVDKLIEAHLGG
jgi:AcrR family transcriptional regulator